MPKKSIFSKSTREFDSMGPSNYLKVGMPMSIMRFHNSLYITARNRVVSTFVASQPKLRHTCSR